MKTKERFVIPIYNIQGMEEFNYQDNLLDIKFEIRMKSYQKSIGDIELANLFEIKDERTLREIIDILFHDEETKLLYDFPLLAVSTLLIIDFETDLKEKGKILLESILSTFHLIFPFGLGYYRFLLKNLNKVKTITPYVGKVQFVNKNLDIQIHTSNFKPLFDSPLVQNRVEKNLKKNDFNSFKIIFNAIYNLNVSEKSHYSRILNQAINYHMLAKTFFNNEQTFVILMIAVEQCLSPLVNFIRI